MKYRNGFAAWLICNGYQSGRRPAITLTAPSDATSCRYFPSLFPFIFRGSVT